jgi:small subunit ribosomal protein S9
MTKKEVFLGTGRRKSAVARVRVISKGSGRIFINGKILTDYFKQTKQQSQVKQPMEATEVSDTIDVKAKVNGGGITGQAGAISLGIARALIEYNPQLRDVCRKQKLLTRDPRKKERKKYGHKGARKSFQWTKR